MMRVKPTSIVAAAVTALGLLIAEAALAQDSAAKVAPAPPPDSVAAARDLYASAAYEESLAVLNRLRALGQPADQATTIEQYRAFCLLALGRSAEAQSAIEAIVVASPLYRPASDEVSPRVRTAFSDVRKRLLPGIVQQRYAEAKAAFDRKDYGTAARGFGDVLAVLNDPDVGAAAGQPPLSDIKTLAGGFSELAVKAIAPPPPSAEPVKPIAAAAPPPAPVPTAPRIYALSDANVVPPVAIKQQVPPFTGQRMPTEPGALEVVVDENGMVESAAMRVPVNATYDRQIVAAASRWRYQPAMLNGKPVKFRKIIQISFKSGN